jgi:hypothetical protein
MTRTAATPATERMREQVMTQQNFSTTISVDQSPEEVFDAINNVRGWWSGEIDGGTDKLSLRPPTRIFTAPPRGSLNSCRGKKSYGTSWRAASTSSQTRPNGTARKLFLRSPGRQGRTPLDACRTSSSHSMLRRGRGSMGLLHQRQFAQPDYEGQGRSNRKKRPGNRVSR